MCCDNAKAPLNIYGSVIVILSGLISRICSRVVGLFNKIARCRNPNRAAAVYRRCTNWEPVPCPGRGALYAAVHSATDCTSVGDCSSAGEVSAAAAGRDNDSDVQSQNNDGKMRLKPAAP